MSIPLNVRELAVATDRARDGYHAGRTTFDEWTRISEEFSDAVEAWKDEVCPIDDDLAPEPPQTGDIYDGPDGLGIITPYGRWNVEPEQALRLIQGLSSMLRFHLTQPWSADDDRTILYRGTRHLKEV